jgi:hypothetical protein
MQEELEIRFRVARGQLTQFSRGQPQVLQAMRMKNPSNEMVLLTSSSSSSESKTNRRACPVRVREVRQQLDTQPIAAIVNSRYRPHPPRKWRPVSPLLTARKDHVEFV